MELTCPLCCGRAFESLSALGTHILEVKEKVLCPLCGVKFEGLDALAAHCQEGCLMGENPLVFVKLEDSKDHLAESLLAKALLAEPDDEPSIEAIDDCALEGGDNFCQVCEIAIKDVNEHLEQFHAGQEVILEEARDDENDAEEAENSVAFEDAATPVALDPTQISFVPDRELNGIMEQEFTDKDGRLYTRKFVKIDKFWLDTEVQSEGNNAKELKVQKIAVERSQVTKSSDREQPVLFELEDNIFVDAHTCRNCEEDFSDMESYKRHKCGKDLRFKCSRCALQFSTLDLLKEHLQVHVTTKIAGPFKCDVCNTIFPTFKSLRLHMRMHDPVKAREVEGSDDTGDTTTFLCSVCNKTYHKDYEEVHTKSHSSQNEYNCDVCNRKFYTKVNLEMHVKAHNNNKKFACSYCKKPFVTFESLNEHLNNQCVQKRQYECQYCGRRFARPHEKVKHERIHTGEKPHVCDICGKAFRVSYCLTLHLRTHSGTRPYQCKHCEKRFKSHSVYNHHLLTHSDLRKYKCTFCSKAFKTSVQLAGHKNSHIKPFTCNECNRPFASLYAVRAHMATHKRDNTLRFECWMCGAQYSRAFALRDHIKQQHQGADLKKVTAVSVAEEMDAASSIIMKEDGIALDVDTANIEIIEQEID